MTKSDEYFKIFCKIIKSIQISSNREEILNLIVQSAVEVMNAKACSLFLVRGRSATDGLFYPAAQVGLSENYIHTGPARGRDITRDIMMKGGYMAIRDATTDPQVTNHAAKKKEGIASLLVVPVIAEKDPIGILALYTAETRDFTRQEVDFLRGLADQGGIAILKAHNEYRQKRNLELLASVSEHLSSSLDINVVLQLMTSEITQAFELLGVSIRLLDDRSNELKLVASYGLSNQYLEKGPVSPERMQALLKKKAEIIDDVSTYGSIDYRDERKAEGIVSMLHIPITIKGRAIGIMGLYIDKKRVISEDDVSLMGSIARQSGLAIQNSSLYLQLEQDKKNLEEEIWGHKAWF
ncbi:MAG: GAF domain-containing protein [Desulforhopalus sp.]